MGGEDSPLPLIYTQMSGNVNFIGTQEEWDALVEKNKLRLLAMKKQTAVDQLRDRLFKEFGFSYSDNIHEELKAIEKEQIIDAHKNSAMFEMDSDRYAEQYYNETFNNTQS